MKVESFEKIEDLFAVINANRIGADLRREPWQKELKIGDHVLRYEPSCDIFIYTRLRDPVEDDRACGSTEEELEGIARLYASPHMEGFRAGLHFSAIVPEGELGDLHVSTVLCKISQAQFDAARAAGWPEKGPGVLTILRMEETVPPRAALFPDYFNG